MIIPISLNEIAVSIFLWRRPLTRVFENVQHIGGLV